MSNEVKNENPFKDKETTEKVEKKSEESNTNSGRKTIDETTINDVKWINLPSAEEIGQSTADIKIIEFFSQQGKDIVTKDGDKFFTGLISSDGEKYDEYIIEGLVDGEKSQLRLANWEVYFKVMRLVKYCKENNFTLQNQIINFERIAEGRKTAGKNWILHVPSLKLKIIDKDNQIEHLK